MAIPANRLRTIGATPSEITAIELGYASQSRAQKDAVTAFLDAMSNADLLAQLTTYRAGGPFALLPFKTTLGGVPEGGQLPFGANVAVLTGNPADDTKAISAGTGIPISAGGGSSGPGYSTPFVGITPPPSPAPNALWVTYTP